MRLLAVLSLPHPRHSIASLILLFGALSPWLHAGCGVTSDRYAKELCDKRCDCEGCTDAESDACPQTIDEIRQIADEAGCNGQLDEFYDCVLDDARCIDGKFDRSHETPHPGVKPTDMGACDPQSYRLDGCVFPKTTCKIDIFDSQCVERRP